MAKWVKLGKMQENRAKCLKIRENKGRKQRSQEEEGKVEGKGEEGIREVKVINIGDNNKQGHIRHKFKLVFICINSRTIDLSSQ